MFAWVIEHRRSSVAEPEYWAGNGWSKDHLRAIRFARREDATRSAAGFDEDDPLPGEPPHRIAEHGWERPRSQNRVKVKEISMVTATEAIQQQPRDHIDDARIFENMVEDFIRSWSPDDPREKAEFCARLHSIIRQVYRDAQEPVFKELHRLISALPMGPLIPSK